MVETIVGDEDALEFAGFGVGLRLANVGGLLTGYSAYVHLKRRGKETFERALYIVINYYVCTFKRVKRENGVPKFPGVTIETGSG